MKITKLRIPGSVQVELQARSDERGYFMRTYDEAIFSEHGPAGPLGADE